MSNSSQPSAAFASAGSDTGSSEPAWASDLDDVAFGCECADPALQIAGWGKEAGQTQVGALST